jgi:hypothetical protein
MSPKADFKKISKIFSKSVVNIWDNFTSFVPTTAKQCK